MEICEAEFYQLELVYNKVFSANKSISSINGIYNMIETLIRNAPWNMKFYSECLHELRVLLEVLKEEQKKTKNMDEILENNQKCLDSAKEICEHYMEPFGQFRYNPNKYTVQYRKEHYKQLNVDLFPEDKEAFVEAVKYNKQTIKNVLRNFILNYISETEKKKKEDNLSNDT